METSKTGHSAGGPESCGLCDIIFSMDVGAVASRAVYFGQMITRCSLPFSRKFHRFGLVVNEDIALK